VKPLQAIGMGLVIVALTVRAGGVDLLPDPLGWALVLHGAVRVGRLPRRSAVTGTLAAALAVAVVLWLPGVDAWLADRDDSLLWAASLPQVAALAVLTGSLATGAGTAGDAGAARWLGAVRTLVVVTGVLPVLVLAAGTASIAVMLLVGLLALLLTIVLAFGFAGREWAAAEPVRTVDQTAAER
jgi:hypothetical protein